MRRIRPFPSPFAKMGLHVAYLAAALATLNFIGVLGTVTVLFPTLQELGRPGSAAAAVRWLSRVRPLAVRLLRYRVTIDDRAAARDSHRRDDRGDQSGKGTRTGFRPSPLPPVCPEHLPARCPSVRDAVHNRRAGAGAASRGRQWSLNLSIDAIVALLTSPPGKW